MTEIVINANDRRIQYTATGGQTVFPYDFPIYANTEITVIRLRSGTLTTMVLTTDFTVSGVGAEAGGNITLVSGATAGDIMTIYGSTPYERTTDYGTGGDFKASTVNKDFDRLAMMTQQLDTRLNRTLSLHIADSSTPLAFAIQTTAARQNGIMSFDSTGTKVETLRTLTDFDDDVAAAAASAAAAATSEANAATSESNAAASETAAAASASSAATSATNAATSATNASNSATAAATSATTATTQATNASNSASAAATSATNASNSASAAATSATNASNSATAAATSASNAATSETNAAASASAAAASAAALRGTSTTSLAIGTGSKTFTTQSGKQFNVGQYVIAVSDANPTTDYMFGQITSYSGTSLQINVLTIGGSGTHADWTIFVSGAQGATGPAGSAPYAAAGGTVDAITADFTPDVSLSQGQTVFVKAAGANTSTTPTFSPDGLTARTIVKNGGVALVAGDIRAAGHMLILVYDLANTRWELLNPVFTQTSVTGNAGTATALQNARTINGTSFDGTANITVTAAAGTLTGTTLAAGVVTSSLTAVGTIATGVWQGTAVAVGYGGTGAATAFAARANLGTDGQLNAKSADYTITTTDNNWTVSLTGSTNRTFSFTAAATLGNGWRCIVWNNSSANITLDPNSTEQVDGATTLTMYPGEVRLVTCSGSAFTTTILNPGDGGYLWVRDEKASTTVGGTSTSATAHTRTLNTVKQNTISGASVASNQITLPAGKYEIIASAPMSIDGSGSLNYHKAYLYNTSDSADTIVGTSEMVDAVTSAGCQTRSFVKGRFSITAQKTFELRHYITIGESNTGLGQPTSTGQVEVYAEVEIWKVG